MNYSELSEKTVGAFEIRQNFGKFIQGILAKGNKYIVERHGEPVAVVVPIKVYQQWKQNRSALFDAMRRTQQKANLSEEEAEKLAEEAVHVIRSTDVNEDSA